MREFATVYWWVGYGIIRSTRQLAAHAEALDVVGKATIETEKKTMSMLNAEWALVVGTMEMTLLQGLVTSINSISQVIDQH